MIIEFSVENYKSIGARQTLHMQPARKTQGKHLVLETGFIREPQVLPCAAILGANASGKSSLIDSLKQFVSMVKQTRERSKEDRFTDKRFKLNSGYRNKPTCFDVSFVAKDGNLYTYSLSYLPEKIVSEEMTRVAPVKNSRVCQLIKRVGDERYIHPSIHEDSQILKMWKEDVNDQQTYFTYLSNKGGVTVFDSPMHWFSSIMFFSDIVPHIITSSLLETKIEKKPWIIEQLSKADIHLSDISVTEEKIDIPEAVLSMIVNDAMKESGDSEEVVRKKLSSDAFKSLNVSVTHKDIAGQDVVFDFDEESDGTKHYYSLLGPILEALEDGRLLVSDELDRSLHSHLVWRLIQLFSLPKNNRKQAQLIFTTHDVTVMDKSLLRPDQIYLTEKDPESYETELLCLSDFEGVNKKDRGFSLDKKYLQGRFGAIPDVDWDWLEETANGENPHGA